MREWGGNDGRYGKEDKRREEENRSEGEYNI
jgi:hypothetical protein